MVDIPVLNVHLHDKLIGTITNLPYDTNQFIFQKQYIEDPLRPTLSLAFKSELGDLIDDPYPRATRTNVPPFFSNLLPEGSMRNYLAERADVHPDREFFLLWVLGGDLPGAITITPAENAPPSNYTNVEETFYNEATEVEGPLRFSLAGVQLKFSAIEKASGGLTIPVKGEGGSWIVKLPSIEFENVPENEYTMMELARRIGLDVPETRLIPIHEIQNLPEITRGTGTHAFAIKRFDRTESGQRVHIEDFAQIFDLYPTSQNKYKAASFRNIAEVLKIEVGTSGIEEFIKRFVFNLLIGNGDMHLKNWSLIYLDEVTPTLAPAYDFVSTIPYIPKDKLALSFANKKSFSSVDLDLLKRFAAKAELPQKLVLDATKKTIEAFAEAWKNIDDLPVPEDIRSAIDTHLKTLPIWNKF